MAITSVNRARARGAAAQFGEVVDWAAALTSSSQPIGAPTKVGAEGDLMPAELTAREEGHFDLREALALFALRSTSHA